MQIERFVARISTSWRTQLVGEVPEDLELPPEDDPWEISMVAYNPIQIEFDDDRIKLALRFTRMEGRDQTISGGAVVTVTYVPHFEDGVLNLSG